MFKAMFFLYRRPDMSVEEFRNYSDDTHVPLVSQVPALRRYVVNYTAMNPGGASIACDAVAELWFDSLEGFQAAVGSSQGETALGDQANYLDMTRTHALFMEEGTIV